jgi:tetratricopeptide (TPR) repeat protein
MELDNGKGFPGVLYRLYSMNQSGILTVTGDGEIRQVYFYKGRPVQVTEPRTTEPLGRILLEMGIISPDDYDLSLIEMARTGKKQGELLMAGGRVTLEQIGMALEAQLRKKLNNIFYLKQPGFTFMPGSRTLPKELDVSQYPHVTTMSVIYHGIKNAMDVGTLEKELKSTPQTVVALSDEYPAVAFSLPLTPEEVLIIEHLASPASVQRLLALKVLTRTELLMLLYFLSVVELVTFSEGREQDIREPSSASAFGGSQGDTVDESDHKTVMDKMTGEYLRQFAGSSSGIKKAFSALAADLNDRFGNIHSMTYYEVLGQDRSAFDETRARKAFGELTRKFHPSNFKSTDLEAVRLAEIVLSKANEAYATLSNAGLKAEYDTSLLATEERKKGKTVLRSGEAELEFQKGDFLLKKGDYRTALTYLRKAVEICGDEADYLAAYGWGLYNDQDQPKEMRENMAKRYLRRAVTMNPSCGRAFIHLAAISRQEGRIDEAWKLLDEAAKVGTEKELLETERARMEFLGSRPIKPAQKDSQEIPPAADDKPQSGIFSSVFGKKKPKS